MTTIQLPLGLLSKNFYFKHLLLECSSVVFYFDMVFTAENRFPIFDSYLVDDDFSTIIFLSIEAPSNCLGKLHAQEVTVWCILWTGGIIGPYFFDVRQKRSTKKHYRRLIIDNFWYEIELRGSCGFNEVVQDAIHHVQTQMFCVKS